VEIEPINQISETVLDRNVCEFSVPANLSFADSPHHLYVDLS